jgi:hypothetical protein
MPGEMHDDDGPTRRAYVECGAAIASGELLAGCTGSAESGSTPESAETTTQTETRTRTPRSVGDSDTVSIAPVGGGTGFKHFRDLGVKDVLATTDIKDFHGSRAAIDLETLLEIDPEVLMLRGYESKSRDEFRNTVVEFLRNHGTASGLSAVTNGDVYRAGGLYRGPITNLVLTERTARQLYDFEGDQFDRQRVADVVRGDV